VSETISKSEEAALSVAREGRAVRLGHDRVVIDLKRRDRVLSAEDDSARQGLILSRNLLGQVDLTPRAEEPQDSWGWEIAGYLYLGGLGAGAFVVAVLLDWLGLHVPPALVRVIGAWEWNWTAIFFYWGAAVTALGASLLIFHLGRNWFLFFTACLNARSSWLARGFLILAAFIVFGGLTGVVAVFFPGWPQAVPTVWRTLQALTLVLACATAIYTGILLRSMKYIPAWDTPILPLLFFASALSTGAMGIAVAALLFRLVSGEATAVHSVLRRIEVADPVVLAAEAVLVVLYLRQLARGKPEGRLSLRMLVSGSWRHLFWGGVVGGALVVPLLLGGTALILPSTDPTSFRLLGARMELTDILVLASAIAVLCGGFLLRLGILAVGIKQRPPLYGLSVWRAEHAMPLAVLDVNDGTAG